MLTLSKAGRTLLSAALALCFSGAALADRNAGQQEPAAQGASDPSSLEKVSTSEYARAHQFTQDAAENTPESVEVSKELQIPDARQFTAKADATNRPVRVFEVVSQDSQFRPIGESIQPASNQEVAASVSFLDNPEYYILLIFGIALLVIIAFGRRTQNNYRLDPVARVN